MMQRILFIGLMAGSCIVAALAVEVGNMNDTKQALVRIDVSLVELNSENPLEYYQKAKEKLLKEKEQSEESLRQLNRWLFWVYLQ